MEQPDGCRLSKPNRSRSRFWLILVVTVAVCVILFFGGILIPVLDGPNSHQHSREAASLGTLRTIQKLEAEYAAAYPKNGFTCQLQLLKPAQRVKDADYDSQEYLLNGERFGYKFTVVSCQVAPNGSVLHYQITAVPIERSKSGSLVFCTDESGVVWYAPAGSGQDCLMSRCPLE